MRALQYTAYGGPEVLEWAEAPEPHPGPGQLRITVRAASVNPIDWKAFTGAMSGGEPMAGTGYLGADAAGVVDEVGEGSPASRSVTRCSAAAATPRPSPPVRRRLLGFAIR